MRIAFIVNNYPPRVGGVELHVKALATELARSGHSPFVITLEKRPTIRSEDGVRVISLRERVRIADILGFPALGTRRALSRFLRDEGIEAVSVHTRFFPMSFLGVRAAKRVGLPVIHTEHGSDHVVSTSPLISFASRLVDLTLGRWVLRHSDEVLGVSEPAVAFVKRISERNGLVFYNAIEAPSVEPSHWPRRPESLVFVGRLVAGKGWETFLDCVALVRRESSNVRAEVFGDGPDREDIRRRVEKLGLQSIVTLHGQVPQAEIRRSLRGATLINPTTLAEGFQTTLLESVAEGGRVLTYPVPGASVLRAQGAPVYITESKDPAELKHLLLSHSDRPWSPFDSLMLQSWTWPVQARAFSGIVDRLVQAEGSEDTESNLPGSSWKCNIRSWRRAPRLTR